MQWVLAFHLVFVVAWFAGLFYLPRLIVYHADATDKISTERFSVMEYRLYRYIMMPAAMLTTLSGFWLFALKARVYLSAGWMLVKLVMVALLWMYHLYCGYLTRRFKVDMNPHCSLFYRFFNEMPTILLIVIVIMAVVQP